MKIKHSNIDDIHTLNYHSWNPDT